jgi:L-ascorbate metabolism protein UlaG (beta-lactamase superfamily)
MWLVVVPIGWGNGMRILQTTFFAVSVSLLQGSTSAIAANCGMTVRFLGINGFEFTTGGETLLIDPYVSRDHRRICIPKVVRKHVKQADYIILTHSHWDHLADVPEIAKYTDALIVGSETTLNICRHFGIPDSRLRQFANHQTIRLGNFALTPIRSKHKEPVGYPGRYERPPKKVEDVSDFVEGGTWALLLTGGGYTFLNIGSANLIDKELQGTECDFLLTSIAGRAPDFLTRLLRCVEATTVIPTHWDDFFGHPVEERRERISLSEFNKEMQKLAPTQTIQTLQPLDTITLAAP